MLRDTDTLQNLSLLECQAGHRPHLAQFISKIESLPSCVLKNQKNLVEIYNAHQGAHLQYLGPVACVQG